ncbi:MAG: gas vesicle protein K [Methylococcaceae bacterium]
MTTKHPLPHHSMADLAAPISPRLSTESVPRKLEIDGDRVRNGLAQLVLTLVKLLHELLERQAIRRMDSGSLTDEEIERLGMTLMRQAEELDKLREVFGLKDDDLNFNLGPLGRLL